MASAREGGECSRGSKYDVFLSFRGEDTRHSFVDCLYEAMVAAGIRVFIDNETLHFGKVIGEGLMGAIEDSKICIPVFSKHYASSKWCLLELEHIMKDRPAQEVMPVFYHVSPDDVKLRTRLYSDDLEVLEKEHATKEVDRWRKCLIEVCKIKGWNLKEDQGEGKLIKSIVQDVLYKTKNRYMSVTDNLVDVEGQIEEMMKLLDDQIDCVRIVIIHGMGGIGKTTLAKVIFNNISSEFEGRSFLLDVRESSLQSNGIVILQKQILNDVLGMSVSIFNKDEGVREIKEKCSNKRVLLVLDDVNETEQVEKLAGMFDWFGRGSRIIITTRDDNVIPNAQRKNNNQKIEGEDNLGYIHHYKMREMDEQYATALFKCYALSDDGNSFDDSKLLPEIVASTGGLPLALKVVGSHLFGKTEAVWRETLKKLRQAPHKEVQNALMISYESLEDDEKEIFLDIACFFRGIEMRFPMYLWEESDLYPKSGLTTLLHKSLIKIDDGDRICMHDQLRDLGRAIVRRDGKSSRIGIHEEALDMILNKKRSRKFKKAAFEDRANLRFLRLEGGNLEGDFSTCFPQIMGLDWSSIPSRRRFLAKNFSPPNLVVLKIAMTDIDERWTGWKGLLGSKLKFLELSGCDGLKRTPDFSTCLKLETLVLDFNNRLIEIDSSIGKLEQLLHLEIKRSLNLTGLPQSLALLKRMENLIVTDVGLESLPKGIGQLKLLKYLSLARCWHLTSLPESVWELESLVELNLSYTGLEGVSGNIGSMKKLKVLNLSFSRIRTLPEGIGGLVKLEVFNLRSTDIVELPSSVIRLSRLQHFYMDYCRKLRKVEHLPMSLSHLHLPYFSLQVVPDLSNLVNIVQLELRSNIYYHGVPITDDEEDSWTRFRSLASIERLPKLKRLVIEVEFWWLSCSVAQFLSQVPNNLTKLILTNFWATTLDLPLFPNLSKLGFYDLLSDEIELRGLEVLGNLQKIEIRSCQSLARLSISSWPKKLNSLVIRFCPDLVEVTGVRLESLQKLKVFMCPSLCTGEDEDLSLNIRE